MKRRSGIGYIEIFIIVGICVVIGALIFVALKPKAKTTSPSPVVKTIDDVKSARNELDQQDVNAADQDLDQLSTSLNNL